MNIIKEISSTQNPLVKHLVRLRQNHDYRMEHETVFVEGITLINDIYQHHHIKTLFVYDECLIPLNSKADAIYVVNEAVMSKISGTQNPEGIAAEIALPKKSSLKGMKFLIAFDGVSDPGNLGTLLRSGLALGWEGAFILNNSCDPYNDKALRAAKGATFRLPFAIGSWEELETLIKQNNLTPLAADTHGTPLTEVKPQKGIVLVLGNESHGLSESASQVCERVTIPMPGQMESLNVSAAGAILMYSLKKGQK